MQRITQWSCLLLVSIIILALQSCSKNDPKPEPAIAKGLYLAGIMPVGKTYAAAVYWRNGDPVYLTDGTTDADVTDITVSGSSIYVLGRAPLGNTYIACYWKDGILTPVTTANSFAYSIGVNGNDVYVAGEEYLWSASTWIPRYWKNGESVNLPGESAVVKAIAVSKGAVYAVGHQYHAVDGNYIATYWKNGIAVTVSDPSVDAFAGAIAVADNGDVYVAGNGYNELSHSVAKYWKNGAEVTLAEGSATSIAVSGSDVFVAGYYVDNGIAKAACWKNGTLIPLEGVAGRSYANSVALDGNDVYTVGAFQGIGGATEKILVWKNGVILNQYDNTTRIQCVKSY